MGVNWMEAIMSGIAGAAGSVGGYLQTQQQNQEKEKLMQMQAQVERQKELFHASLQAPVERSLTQDDPTTPGQKVKVNWVWVPPTADGQAGHYQEVSRETIPAISPAEQAKLDLEGKHYDTIAGYEKARIGMEGDRLKAEQAHWGAEEGLARDKFNAEMDPTRQKAALMPYEHFMIEGDDGTKVPYRFDRRSGDTQRITPGGQSASNGPDSSSGNMTSAAMSGGADGAPMGQLARSNTPQYKATASPTGGSGSQQTPKPTTPAPGSQGPGGMSGSQNGHGRVIRTGTRNGVKVAQYEDGTIAPL